MDGFLNLIKNELSAWFYVITGVVMLGIGMAISDFAESIFQRIWKH